MYICVINAGRTIVEAKDIQPTSWLSGRWHRAIVREQRITSHDRPLFYQKILQPAFCLIICCLSVTKNLREFRGGVHLGSALDGRPQRRVVTG